MKAVISNRIYMDMELELHASLIKELSYTLPPSRPGGMSEIFCDVTVVNRNVISIPNAREDLIPKGYEIIDKRVSVPAIFPTFKYELRDDQKDVYNQVNGSCIINANPAYGKTFTSLAIAAKLGQKTLVVVHTLYLKDQWVGEIEKTLGFTPDTIGAKGVCGLGTCIVVANVQSLKKHIDKIHSTFGTLIIDECHHTPATTFKAVIDKFKGKHRIGLTGTLWRKDRKHLYIPDYLSKNIIVAKEANRLSPEVTVVSLDVKIPGNKTTPWAIRVNRLYENVEFMENVINSAKIQAEKGHKVLVVSDRVEMLELCSSFLDNSMVVTGETEDRDFIKSKKDILFGASKIYSEGVNIPELSCLILAMTTNNVGLLEQLLGRISRNHPGKKNPEVIDFALVGQTAKRHLQTRVGFYIEKKYKIKYV